MIKKYAFVGNNLTGNNFKPGRRILLDAMKERGIREDQVEYFTPNSHSKKRCLSGDFKVVVAFGNEALKLFVEDAWDVKQTRGYVFESGGYKTPIVPTIDPTFINKAWVPWRMLLSLDLGRSKEICKMVDTHQIGRQGFNQCRPLREVIVL